MQTGLGHQSTSDATPDGAMAIFCPACPQPGINLPKDWKMQYTPYVITLHMILYIFIFHIKGTAHPDIYYGWKLLRRAYAP